MSEEIKDIEQLERERQEYLEGWKRAKADYENLKKETEKNKALIAGHAIEDCLIRLLPAIDQYHVALQFIPSLDAIPEDDRRQFETWITGLEAVKQLWEEAAEGLGLEVIKADGAMNPELHEAVGSEPSEQHASMDIIRVVQPGYKIGERIIRPAKVIVAI